MARGNSKLSGRGRGRDNADETGPEQSAWPPDAGNAPAAPSPARTILPGQPFEPVAPQFPAQRQPDGTTAGWDLLPTQGGYDPTGLHTDPNTISWPSATTAPMQAMPTSVGMTQVGDPLDALQQYAGLPLAGYPGAAPAPDPTQLYQPQAPMTNSPGVDGSAGHYGPATSSMSAGPSQATPLQNGYGSPADSGFADGGMFTGGQPFDGPPTGAPVAPGGYGMPGGLGQQLPPLSGHIPQTSLQPLDVFSTTTGPAAGGSVLPGSDDFPGERSRRGRRRRGKAASANDSERPESNHYDHAHYSGAHSGTHSGAHSGAGRGIGRTADSGTSSNSGARRAVALLGAVAVLGGAGYVGYSQLTGTDQAVSSTSTSVRPANAAAGAKYVLPNQLANLTQIAPTEATQLTAGYTTLSKKRAPELPMPAQVSAYRPTPAAVSTVNVVIYKPGAPNLYNALVGLLSRPDAGSAAVAAAPVASGAAGGTMVCGAQRGASTSAWCAWTSGKGIGLITANGTDNPTYAAIYTRELRAYAER
ncbi:MAG TPA: hypothetical protein VLR26_10740 [Frankiaceae bacterium]|nr:hypothetical protein [Frankiaceae bacterium]